MLGWLGTTLSSPDQPAVEVLSEILSGMSGRLFIHLRDEQSLMGWSRGLLLVILVVLRRRQSRRSGGLSRNLTGSKKSWLRKRSWSGQRIV